MFSYYMPFCRVDSSLKFVALAIVGYIALTSVFISGVVDKYESYYE